MGQIWDNQLITERYFQRLEQSMAKSGGGNLDQGCQLRSETDLKKSRFVQFGANLTQLGAGSEIPVKNVLAPETHQTRRIWGGSGYRYFLKRNKYALNLPSKWPKLIQM